MMPTRRIADVKPACLDREHYPPSHMVYKPGVYEHTCLACGQVQRFTVNPPT